MMRCMVLFHVWESDSLHLNDPDKNHERCQLSALRHFAALSDEPIPSLYKLHSNMDTNTHSLN